MGSHPYVPNLTGVPETMLWTLHNRAGEARRGDTFLQDPRCVQIYNSIQYDYERSFGKPDGSHPMRSRIFDAALKPWLAQHPGGTVVELAAGLETEFYRVDDGRVRWICVDLPEAIAIRERFLPASDRCRHLPLSALDPRWIDEIQDPERGVFITAQGLLMYFEEREVRRFFEAVSARLPGAHLMFDAIPRWFSRKTLKGFGKTKYYIAPPMPWGVDRDEIEETLRAWNPGLSAIKIIPYGYARGGMAYILWLFSKFPGLRNIIPSIVHLSL